MSRKGLLNSAAAIALSTLLTLSAQAAERPIPIMFDWDKEVATVRTEIGLGVSPEPPMFRGRKTHDSVYRALRDFGGQFARLQPWSPYPKLAVAELEPPNGTGTHWDFRLLDQIVEDFMAATEGRQVIFQPGAIPAWMLDSASTKYPEAPEEIEWSYGAGGKINESTVDNFAKYQARIASWYIRGGFSDEDGIWHGSGHAYKFTYWEPLNEEDVRFSPMEVVQLYDAAVEAVRKVDPALKFVGPTLAKTSEGSEYLSYFLNPKNHKTGIPIDIISYHLYTVTQLDETPDITQHVLFKDADLILTTVGYIETLRKQFRADWQTNIDELGPILMHPTAFRPIPRSYWMMTGGAWAYLYGHLAEKGIDFLTAAELIDYPGQYAGTTLLDWKSGTPNARYWVIKLLRDNFEPGARIVSPHPVDLAVTINGTDYSFRVYAQGFLTPDGKRKILLVNKRNRPLDVLVPGLSGGAEQHVDGSTSGVKPERRLRSNVLRMAPSSVVIVTLADQRRAADAAAIKH